MEDHDLDFDFETGLDPIGKALGSSAGGHQDNRPPILPPGVHVGQQPGNYKKNFKKTVCKFWLKGLCMKGDTCGFLHQCDQEKMPVCNVFLKHGVCKETDCPYKHALDDIKECNMYKLGFCIYGPQCRYKHTRLDGPPPLPETIEAAKPKEFRDINTVVNYANTGIAVNNRKPRFNFPPHGKDHQLPGGPGAGQMQVFQMANSDVLASVGQQGLPYGF